MSFHSLFIALINLSQNYRKEAQQIDQEISERLFFNLLKLQVHTVISGRFWLGFERGSIITSICELSCPRILRHLPCPQ